MLEKNPNSDSSNRPSKQSTGMSGEQMAEAFLVKLGYQILHRNWRFGHREIDIVAKDGEYTVFVEVKTRRNAAFGEAILAITPAKQRQMLQAAQGYIFKQGMQEMICRFDVVTIDYKNGEPVLEHIPNAFTTMP